MRISSQAGRNCKRATGQAVIESIIVTGTLATVGALAVMLGKVQMASQANFGASHSVAFECAMLPQRCTRSMSTTGTETTSRLKRNHFTQDKSGLAQVAAWTDRAGSPMLESPDQIKTSLAHPHFGAGAITKLTNRFGLNDGGLVTSTVQLDLMQDATQSQSPDLLSRLPLSFVAKSAILTDHWNASSPYGVQPTSVQVRVDQGKKLPKAAEIGFKIAYAPTRASMLFMWGLLLESDARKFKYHDVDMDIVPADRLEQ